MNSFFAVQTAPFEDLTEEQALVKQSTVILPAAGVSTELRQAHDRGLAGLDIAKTVQKRTFFFGKPLLEQFLIQIHDQGVEPSAPVFDLGFYRQVQRECALELMRALQS